MSSRIIKAIVSTFFVVLLLMKGYDFSFVGILFLALILINTIFLSLPKHILWIASIFFVYLMIIREDKVLNTSSCHGFLLECSINGWLIIGPIVIISLAILLLIIQLVQYLIKKKKMKNPLSIS